MTSGKSARCTCAGGLCGKGLKGGGIGVGVGLDGGGNVLVAEVENGKGEALRCCR